ncbi:MAG: tetratricopeptide repeat protein, partial [Armatimonadetes bacterium]|nr:tetratricopeptide repeat protein [Armatimonadota bacterium]
MYSFYSADSWDSLDEMVGAAAGYLKTGRTDVALELLREVLRNDPQHVGAHISLTHALRVAGRADEALTHLSDALSTLPEEESLHMALGDVQADLGQHDAAIREYQRALEITPNYAEAYHRIGMAHQKRGRLEA